MGRCIHRPIFIRIFVVAFFLRLPYTSIIMEKGYVMPSKKPKVSVLTPIYNTNPQHLREMIESVLAQTFTDFEFLILNDSPENRDIEKIVLEYAKHDKRVKYSKNAKNMGITPSRNKLLKMATGEYLAVFDHDDISMPTRLEQEVAYLDSNPSVGVVSGWLEYFGTDNNIWKTPENDTDIRVLLCDGCYIAHTAAMVRKSVLIDNDIQYEEFYTPAEDYQLWARLANVTYFHNIQQILVKYRWTGDNTSNKQNDRRESARRAIYLDFRDKHPGLYDEFKKMSPNTMFRLNFLGIPILKIKHNKILLFEFIPVFKMWWK